MVYELHWFMLKTVCIWNFVGIILRSTCWPDINGDYITWKLENTQPELSGGGGSRGWCRSSYTSDSSSTQQWLRSNSWQETNVTRPYIYWTTAKDLHENAATFQQRQKLIHDPEQCSIVLKLFARFLDAKGLVSSHKLSFQCILCQEQLSQDENAHLLQLPSWHQNFLRNREHSWRLEKESIQNPQHLPDYLIQSAEENLDEDYEVPGEWLCCNARLMKAKASFSIV